MRNRLFCRLKSLLVLTIEKEMRGDGMSNRILGLFYLFNTIKTSLLLDIKESKLYLILEFAKFLELFRNILQKEPQHNVEAIIKK